jgi:hypothetical protein
MPTHSYNHGIVTSAKGVALENFNVAIGAAGAVGAILQSSSNLVASVVRTSIGLYTVQLNTPYPPRLSACHVSFAQAVPGADTVIGYLTQGSYNATTGQFTISVSDLEIPAADDPPNPSTMFVTLIFDRYTRT